MIAYRPDIDGLRALAILPVLFFHAGISPFSGGFVGVDVFFVISGYLITGMLVAQDKPSIGLLKTFWIRRARRILPALFIMLFVTLAFATLLSPPALLRTFGTSLAASALFLANMHFFRAQADYFRLSPEQEPLLHLWSLGIEEQFYLIWPMLLLLLLWRAPRRTGVIVAMLAIASLALGALWVESRPAYGFFLLPARGWELLAGALCALVPMPRLVPMVRHAAVLLGLLCIVVPVFAYRPTMPFPGLLALPPVIGTMLIILFAKADQGPGRWLATRPAVGIGLISYGTYLWHQPVLSFSALLFPGWSLSRQLFCLAVSLVLGAASLRWVERPFRRGQGDARFLLACALSAVVLAGCGVLLSRSDGFPARVPADVVRLDMIRQETGAKLARCLADAKGKWPEGAPCRTGHGPAVDVVVIGDSHAASLMPGLQEAFPPQRHTMLQLTMAGCVPHDPALPLAGVRPACRAFMQQLLKQLADMPSVRTIIVAGRWTSRISSAPFDNGEGGREAHWKRAQGEFARPQDLSESLSALMRALDQGRASVLLVDSVPEAGWNVPRLLTAHALRRDAAAATFSTSHALYRERNKEALAVVQQAIRGTDVKLIHTADGLCPAAQPRRCMVALDGEPLYMDSDHLTAFGARLALKGLQAR